MATRSVEPTVSPVETNTPGEELRLVRSMIGLLQTACLATEVEMDPLQAYDLLAVIDVKIERAATALGVA